MLHLRLGVVKDNTTLWQELSDLKDSCSLQVAKFTLAAGIASEPPSTGEYCGSSRRGTILSPWLSAKHLLHKHAKQYGIELLKTLEEAYTIDTVTCTTFLVQLD